MSGLTPARPRPARGSATRRATATIAGALAATVLTGCTVPRPEVTFYGNRASTAVAPTLWCAVDSAKLTISCPDTDQSHFGKLRLRPGDGVEISVPPQVGDTPWGVYLQYRTPSGKVLEARSEFFTDSQLAYTLRPPQAVDQLVRVEVQSGVVPTATTSGKSVDFAATRTWVLQITPVPRASSSAAG